MAPAQKSAAPVGAPPTAPACAPTAAQTAAQIANRVRSGEATATDAVQHSLAEMANRDPDIGAFILTLVDEAQQTAADIDQQIKDGKDPGPLASVPVALKDNMCTRAIPTTCCSRILEGWRPPYDATVVSRLRQAGAVIVGKTNMDEFAMGSSTENSAFQTTKNPRDTDRVPGGSSGGSAAAVAAGFVPLSLGSDTGGSIRQPAALCGVVGVKPTYGLVSRYGLVAFASSLDQIGPFSQTVEDAALLLEVIAGHDPLDSTSIPAPAPSLVESVEAGARGEGIVDLRVGLVSEFLGGAAGGSATGNAAAGNGAAGNAMAGDIIDRIHAAAQALADAGATVDEVSVPDVRHGLAAYYLIATAEASSNLARYDGVRYGLRVDASNAVDMNIATRTQGFGEEVKRRIMLGTFALSAGYYDAYYGKAQKVRTLIIEDFARAYEKFDVLLAPTSPTTAFALGSRLENPLDMYLSDVCTIPSSLAGHPAMSVPFGAGADGLPVGVQVLAPAQGEDVMFRVGAFLEQAAPAAASGPPTAAPTHAPAAPTPEAAP